MVVPRVYEAIVMLPGVRTHTVLLSRRSPSQLRFTRGRQTLIWSSLVTRREDHASELKALRSLAMRYFSIVDYGYAVRFSELVTHNRLSEPPCRLPGGLVRG